MTGKPVPIRVPCMHLSHSGCTQIMNNIILHPPKDAKYGYQECHAPCLYCTATVYAFHLLKIYKLNWRILGLYKVLAWKKALTYVLSAPTSRCLDLMCRNRSSTSTFHYITSMQASVVMAGASIVPPLRKDRDSFIFFVKHI